MADRVYTDEEIAEAYAEVEAALAELDKIAEESDERDALEQAGGQPT